MCPGVEVESNIEWRNMLDKNEQIGNSYSLSNQKSRT